MKKITTIILAVLTFTAMQVVAQERPRITIGDFNLTEETMTVDKFVEYLGKPTYVTYTKSTEYNFLEYYDKDKNDVLTIGFYDGEPVNFITFSVRDERLSVNNKVMVGDHYTKTEELGYEKHFYHEPELDNDYGYAYYSAYQVNPTFTLPALPWTQKYSEKIYDEIDWTYSIIFYIDKNDKIVKITLYKVGAQF